MPSATQRHLTGLQPSPQLAFPPSYRPNDVLIGTWSWCAIGPEIVGIASSAFASATYPNASVARGWQFEIADSFLVQKLWWVNGTTASTDHADVGVYADGSGGSLLVSAGSTLIAGANVVQEVDVTDTLLPAGRYWCVYNQDGVTATPIATTPSAGLLRMAGCAQTFLDGAVPLASTWNPAAAGAAFMPLFGIAGRTQVA